MSRTAAGPQINSAPVLLRRVEPGRVTAARYGAGFWLIAFVFVTGMAFSTVPTPLYPLYQTRDGFSTFTVTVVFAVYVVGVLTSLLLAGQVSDLVGRKKVLTTALTLELIAAALFLAEPPLPCCSLPGSSPVWVSACLPRLRRRTYTTCMRRAAGRLGATVRDPVDRGLHHPSHALAGLVVFAVFAAAAVAQPLTSVVTARARSSIGLLAQAAGVVVLVTAMHITSLATFLLGGIAAGIGAAVLFKSAVSAVAGMAQPAMRGEAMAGLYIVSFLGMAVPAVGLGLATRYTTAIAATTVFTGVLIVLLAVVGVLGRRSPAPLRGRATARRREVLPLDASQRSAPNPAAKAPTAGGR